MTNDEFERILTAAVQMRTLYISGDYMVSLKGLMSIVQSQLHPEDRDKWVWSDEGGKYGWLKKPL